MEAKTKMADVDRDDFRNVILYCGGGSASRTNRPAKHNDGHRGRD